MAYVAQLLPDREQANVILTALTEFIANRGTNYDNDEVLVAESIKAELITDMRRSKT